jgi:hypothetical protein
MEGVVRPLVPIALLLLSDLMCASAEPQKLVFAHAATPSQDAAQNARPRGDDDDAILARAGRLYYSTRAAGLNGFDCAIHPDWRTLIQSSVKNAMLYDIDPGVLNLQKVAITLDARLNGGSKVDWTQRPDTGKPADAKTARQLDQMHKAIDETLVGFMQFWTPFVDGSIVPAHSSGIDITPTATGITIHIKRPGASVTELFSNDLVLQRFSVITDAAAVDLSPSYDSTDKGLLVSRFVARIRKNGAPAEKAEEMHVEIYYQQVSGFPLPSRLNVEVIGTGVFNFGIDACRVNPAD